MRPEVVRNSLIASALRVSFLGPLFFWGANEELWPALIAAVCFSLCLNLIVIPRLPVLELLSRAQNRDKPTTIYAFIAHRYGGSRRVQFAAAGLTIFSLLGLLGCEAFGMASLLKPFLPAGNVSIFGVMAILLSLMLLATLTVGDAGALFTTQSLLALIYFGLLGSTMLLIYVQASDLRPLNPPAAMATLFLFVFCAALLWYRHTKYAETAPPVSPEVRGYRRTLAKTVGRLLKLLNTSISVFAAVILAVALMQINHADLLTIARDSVTVFYGGTRASGLTLVALGVITLCLPIVDAIAWHHVAILGKAQRETGTEPSHESLRQILRMHSGEAPLFWIFASMLGVLALNATETEAGPNAIQSVAEQLIAIDEPISHVILGFFLLSLLAMAVSMMSSSFSTIASILQDDFLQPVRPGPDQSQARRHSVIIGLMLAVIIASFIGSLGIYFQINVGDVWFVRLVLGFLCVQAALAPLLTFAFIRPAEGPSQDL
jgi:hypothetical protein